MLKLFVLIKISYSFSSSSLNASRASSNLPLSLSCFMFLFLHIICHNKNRSNFFLFRIFDLVKEKNITILFISGTFKQMPAVQLHGWSNLLVLFKWIVYFSQRVIKISKLVLGDLIQGIDISI